MPKSEHLNGEPVKNQQQLARALGVGFALFGLACSSSGGSGNPGSGGTMSGGGTAGSAGAAGFGGAGGGAANGPTGDPLIDKYICADQAGAPAVAAVHPTVEQEAYQHVELTAYIHYGRGPFDGTEQGNVSDTAAVFNPTNLTQATVDHWVSTLQNAGFQQVQLTDKHSTGFCLWQSATTNYSVANSPWMGGKGDLVKMFTDSMKRANLRVGVYLSPRDQRVPSSVQSYGSVLTEQLTELLTNYGNVYEITWDGFNSAGSHGTPATVDWAKISQKAKTLQPHILVWAGPEVSEQMSAENPPSFPDLQWIGNENGQASRTTSSLDLTNCAALLDGTMVGKNLWCPYESNVSSHMPNWFWHPNQPPMSAASMERIYFRTIGMNSTLIFNIPPDQTGDFDPQDVALLNDFGTWYQSTFKTDLLKGAPATADSTWASAGFEACKAVDDDYCTYWAAADGKTTGTLEVTPASPASINVISTREPIKMGERVTKYHIELNQNGTWATPSDVNDNKVQGTVIGNRQLWQMNNVSATGIRLVIESARDVPLIAELSAY